MVRIILYFAALGAAAAGFAWLADRPGSLRVEWLGYDIRTSVFIAGVLVLVAFAVIFLAGWLGILTWTAPKRIAQRIRRRRVRIGQDAVRRGIFAAGAGDKAAAARAGAIASKHVPDEPLALLLEAQAAQLNEDGIASRQAFERMLERPDMTELGLRGLFIESRNTGQQEAARQFAERALALNPRLAWSSAALFDMQCQEGDWRGALRTLGVAKQNRPMARSEADSRRALLLTQLASEIEETQQGRALAYALEAFGLMPRLTPAAMIAGRILAGQGNSQRAAKVLTQAWRTEQHPELALIYAHARTGDSPRDRLTRVKTLVATGSASLEGDIAVAAAAVEAKDWRAARVALEPHLANTPPARVCRLMARIEAGETRDTGRAREWLAKAKRGAPDPVWVAPDGSFSAEWRAISPASGALGVYEWKTPPAENPAMREEPDDLALDTVNDGSDQVMPEASAALLPPLAPYTQPATRATDRGTILDQDPDWRTSGSEELLPTPAPSAASDDEGVAPFHAEGESQKTQRHAGNAPNGVTGGEANLSQANPLKDEVTSRNASEPGQGTPHEIHPSNAPSLLEESERHHSEPDMKPREAHRLGPDGEPAHPL